MEIKEIFYSRQGEGYNFGKPVIFVRFAGCNLDCSWCDEAQSRRNNRENLGYQITEAETLERIQSLMENNNCYSIIFTGGEPSLYLNDVRNIVKYFNSRYRNMWYGCESNGTGSPDFYELMNFTCISPKYQQTKLDKFILTKDNLSMKGELRIVVDRCDKDFKDWVKTMLIIGKKHNLFLYLSPVTSFRGKDMLDWTDTRWLFDIENTMNVYNQLKEDFDLRISLQTHKLIGMR